MSMSLGGWRLGESFPSEVERALGPPLHPRPGIDHPAVVA
jgi:hypothetical protein